MTQTVICNRRNLSAALAALLLLSGCSGESASEKPVEVVQMRPLALSIAADGEVRSTKSTPLPVPGRQWSRRRLEWMAPEGSTVREGELIARFTADEAELSLSQALIDLQRNALSRSNKQGELDAAQGRVDVDLAAVDSQLRIADRYAEADLDMLARNEILDAIQDKEFLGAKQGVLEWKRDQAGERGAAELAVLDSKRSSLQLSENTSRQDLAALELRAPHDGVLVLESNWTGDKPQVGSSLWAGNEFGSLPDTASLEVELVLPQIEAQGVKKGDRVVMHPAGRPDQKVESELSWVASAAQVRGRRNPIKYLSMKASIPKEAVSRYGLVPGQAFSAEIHTSDDSEALTVPNVALVSENGRHFVEVGEGDDFERREVTLGERGVARSRVTDGLNAGERVLLTPDRSRETAEPAAPAEDPRAAGIAKARARAAAAANAEAAK
ncbi:MAG: hypothetical protein R3F12_03980 [Lysobacteraceae bacterium]|nr:hypothetical protein [Xanthomonadaceae bacterium]HRX99214.1 hypothetical protein [Xanthomonadaceae bacterium]